MITDNKCRFEKQREYLLRMIKGRLDLFNELKSKGVSLFDEEIKTDTKRYMRLKDSSKISNVV